MDRQRIGVYGGTFDPIHVGHLLLAEIAREQLELDRVLFMPAAISPLKQGQQVSDGKERVEMIKLAISGNPLFQVDDRELEREGPSYTVDTLAEMANQWPEAELFFLMGADSLEEFHLWKSPEEICKKAEVRVLARGGYTFPDISKLEKFLPTEKLGDSKQMVIQMPQVEISASEIRQRTKEKRTIRYQVAPAVEAYIENQSLYR